MSSADPRPLRGRATWVADPPARCWWLSFAALSTTLILAGSATPGRAQNFCDQGLARSAELGATGYRNVPPSAPDRCEGEYVREVSRTSGLRVAGLLAAPRNVAPGASKIRLAWLSPWPERRVTIRGEGFGRDFYRMDTRLEGALAFDWSTDRWDPKRRPESLGVVAWADHDGGRVLLPVTVGDAAPTGTRYLLELEPVKELDEIYLSVAPADESGSPGAFLFEERPVGNSVYPKRACSRLEFELEAPRGIYFLEIAAAVNGGGAAVEELLFYHHGPSAPTP